MENITVFIQYKNIKGGINNLQVATVKNMNGTVVKVFTSKKHRAKEYATRFIKNELTKKNTLL